jgi:hypothetical protein
MTGLHFTAMPSDIAAAYRDGALDANGQPPERHVSDGSPIPCRHCLAPVKDGDPYLILAHRPFPTLQPYAEAGPIFLHAEECPRYPESADVPAMYRHWQHVLMRGYGHDDRIVYGSGQVVPADRIEFVAADLLARDEIAYLHLRTAQYNCYQVRIDRA